MASETSAAYRRLERTALHIGPLAVGTVNFGWLTSEPDSFAILDSAVDRGLNLVDTSDNYNAGNTETLLDSALHGIGIELSAEVMARLNDIFPGPGGEAPEAYAW